ARVALVARPDQPVGRGDLVIRSRGHGGPVGDNVPRRKAALAERRIQHLLQRFARAHHAVEPFRRLVVFFCLARHRSRACAQPVPWVKSRSCQMPPRGKTPRLLSTLPRSSHGTTSMPARCPGAPPPPIAPAAFVPTR